MSHTPSQITEIMQIIILIFITTMIEVFSIMSTIVQNINSLIISAIIINTLISPKIISGLIRTFLITKDNAIYSDKTGSYVYTSINK